MGTQNIRSNLWVARNGRFGVSVYSGGGTMVVKILDFRFFQSLKSGLSRTFCSPKSSLGSWILYCLCENFPEYPSDIHNTNSNNSYLIPQHFSGFKNYKLKILKLVPGASFASCQNNKCFYWPGSTAHNEDSGQEQCTHLIWLLVAKIFKKIF